jgi:CheY-like chemotaxis protein
MILVVEDNMDDSFLLTRQLARAQLAEHVHVIGDGLDALGYLLESAETPQVLFLDLHLPRLGGLELLRRIRREPRLESMSVIVMTGSLNPSDVERCGELGVTAYLPKPVDISTFTSLIRPLISEMSGAF